MAGYKRNQVEGAISAVLQRRSPQLAIELRTRIKRLLATDRSLGRNPRSSDSERANYAFFNVDPPGSGSEIWFSDYEAFALLTGLQLLSHGWPQVFAVTVMRRVRQDLENEHRRILQQDPSNLFDQKAIRLNAKPGDLAFDNTDPVLLVIVTKSDTRTHQHGDLFACAVCRGPDAAMNFFSKLGGSGAGVLTMSDVVGVAHALSSALALTVPQHRGRA